MICLCFSNPLHLSLSCVTLFHFTICMPSFVCLFNNTHNLNALLVELYSTEITFYHFFSHSHSGRSCSSSIIGLDLFVLFEIKILFSHFIPLYILNSYIFCNSIPHCHHIQLIYNLLQFDHNSYNVRS